MPAPEVLAALPALDRLPALLRAIAVLDVVMTDDEGSRYYTWDPAWDEGEAVGRMFNGSGDDWHCWIGPPGAAIVGFDHESDLSPYAADPPRAWPGVLDGVPEAFRAPVLEEPAFSIEDTTFLVWRLRDDDAWRSGPVELPEGPDPDGAAGILELLLDDDPHAYVGFAVEHYENRAPDLDAVAAIYRGEPLTAGLVAALNPERDPAAALAEAAETGHPTA